MKKIGKVCAIAILGMLVVMNFAAAMPAGDSGNSEMESIDSRPKEMNPNLPNHPNNPDEINELDTNGENQDVIPGQPYESPDPDDPFEFNFQSPLASPPPPPTPAGFNSPITPQTGVVPLLTLFIEWSDGPGDTPPSFVQNQLFGPRPSLQDYMIETSYWQFTYSDIGHYVWIPAWDNPATTGDESTRTYWESASDPTSKG
jgi:hypothetical protein